ncbi:MAG: hypothetical protein LBC70_00795 [Chitinispirillales bacterium]|jgi:hypothetical protein|nr:hypothetical protein [Chitinispirillales bacterium]
MKKLNMDDVVEYVEKNIETFHLKRLQNLEKLKLSKILKKKNPYLFKAKSVETSDEIVRGIVGAYVSSSEETIFGDWLEGLAIFINQKVFNGWKSTTSGIDLEFDKEGTRYIVAIKSSVKWGNSSQIAKLRADFNAAKKTLRTSNSKLNIMAVNGCCYGIDNKPDKGDYLKYCGQQFWSFISGNDNLYIDIIEPLGYKAREQNKCFQKAYNKLLNRFIKEFSNEYCKDSGEIDWDKIVTLNSGLLKLKH